MRYGRLGNTGLRASRISLGTWELSSAWGQVTPERSAAVRRAYELGVNFFDTAYAYGFGAAESGLASALREILKTHREELVILTKGGVEQLGSSVVCNSDEAFLRRGLEDSLRALGTDYVDVFLIHWPDPTVPFAETAQVLESFVAAGVARHVGVSNFSIEQMEVFRAGGRLEVAQLPYNLFRRQIEASLLPYCAEAGIGVMGYAALGQGLLTGTLKVDEPLPEGDWRAKDAWFTGDGHRRRLEAVERLREIADGRGCTVAQLALAWILANPTPVFPIVGAQLPEHVNDSFEALDMTLTADEIAELTAIVELVPQIDRAPSVPTRT